MAEGSTTPGTKKVKVPQKCLIYPLPKVIFFYPTAIVSFICAIGVHFLDSRIDNDVIPQAAAYGYLNKDEIDAEFESEQGALTISSKEEGWVRPAWDDDQKKAWRAVATQIGASTRESPVQPNFYLGWFWVVIFSTNILVIAFDFPGVKAMAASFLVIALGTGGALLNMKYKFLPFLETLITSITPYCSAGFYVFVGVILTSIIGVGVLVNRFWNKWIIESNRLVHKHGMLGDVREWPTINLQIKKEINDVFEFVLLMSGSLIFTTGPNERPIVLENVIWINRKEKQIRRILEAWRIGET